MNARGGEAEPDPADLEQPVLKPPPTAGRKHVVVFTDDEPQILLALERALRGEPYDLLMTTDPEKSLHWIKTRRVSVVIADYRMPGMRGTTLLEKAQDCAPHVARILLTAYPEDKDVLAARQAGLLSLFAKPWNAQELKQAILKRIRESDLREAL